MKCLVRYFYYELNKSWSRNGFWIKTIDLVAKHKCGPFAGMLLTIGQHAKHMHVLQAPPPGFTSVYLSEPAFVSKSVRFGVNSGKAAGGGR